MNLPENLTLLEMNATDIKDKTYRVILETVNHFEIILDIREQYERITGTVAAYDYDTQIITMNLTEELIFQVIEIIQDAAGRIETPDTYPTEEELDAHLYHLLTTPTRTTPTTLNESEAPF